MRLNRGFAFPCLTAAPYTCLRITMAFGLSYRVPQTRYRPSGPSHRHNARTLAAAGSRVKVGGYQGRIILDKASPGGSAHLWQEVVESRIPWINATLYSQG